eukprot:TRINITY_DN3238_c0_g3_i9.p3 TRINITY_DN3238_c0_g3~~TRINITY_DN3238_c0_g3_i9.p3  ORF type:complete len:118 (-),score=27.23 TRINITY_DN3238_c0_g3_i9:934-1287(-)
MIQDEVGTCQDCGKKLRIRNDPNNPIPILTKDQLLHDSPSSAKSKAGTSDLLVYPVCLECLDHMIAGVEQSIKSGEKVFNEYSDSINNINKEIENLISRLECKRRLVEDARGREALG